MSLKAKQSFFLPSLLLPSGWMVFSPLDVGLKARRCNGRWGPVTFGGSAVSSNLLSPWCGASRSPGYERNGEMSAREGER